jgi:hypothetical protein
MKTAAQQSLTPSGAEIPRLLHLAEASLGYFLARFQSLHCPKHSLKVRPLALNREQNFSFLIFQFELFYTWINHNQISKGVLYTISSH